MTAETTKPRTGKKAPSRSHVSWWLVVLLVPIHYLVMFLYFRPRVIGRERLPASGPIIIAPTHRSRWDALFLALIMLRRMRYMVSEDEFIGLQGWLMRHLGTFAVDPRRPAPTTLKHCAELLTQGEPLVIFPEGTVFFYPPNQVHPIKSGAAWVALHVQEELPPDQPISIVPVRLNYSDIHPRFRTRGDVVIQEPIRVDAYRHLPRKEAIRALTADLQRALGDEVNTSLAERLPDRPRPEDEAS